MKFIRKFDIDIIRLKEGRHNFNFEIDSEFLDQFENSREIVNDVAIKASIELDKRINLIEVVFHLKGKVNITCDRSLEDFDYPLDLSHKILYKYGQEEKEISDEIFFITADTQSINVMQLIYEFILLGIPAKKIHPDHLTEEDEDDEDEGDGWIVYEAGENNLSEEQIKDDQNPFWKALKNLKNKE
tara:strand:+ start:185 stop:742 length:558 start_codon:yes stop_codon:yes gene_type:complete